MNAEPKVLTKSKHLLCLNQSNIDVLPKSKN